MKKPLVCPGILTAMPGTQENGDVSLSFDENTNALLADSSNDGQHTFRMVVTGDDNPDSDCHHNGLTMIIEYEYLVMQLKGNHRVPSVLMPSLLLFCRDTATRHMRTLSFFALQSLSNPILS